MPPKVDLSGMQALQILYTLLNHVSGPSDKFFTLIDLKSSDRSSFTRHWSRKRNFQLRSSIVTDVSLREIEA
jgi:hypothetical protein